MGFSFQVFPSRSVLPEPGAICARASELLRALLVRLPVGKMVWLSDELLVRAEAQLGRAAEAVSIEPAPQGDWGEGAVGFAVRPGVGRGTMERLELSGWTWYEPEASRLIERGLAARWERARVLGYRLEVARLFAEPALSAIGHGFVAAALAEATEGFLFSPDGAWDGALLPCSADEFLRSFMCPELSAGERFRRYAEDKLRALPQELEVFDATFVEAVLQQIVGRMVSEMNRVRGNPNAELTVIEHALAQVETARVLSGGRREIERRVLVGSQAEFSPAGPEGAFARLHPTPAEYERWLGHLGEMLP